MQINISQYLSFLKGLKSFRPTETTSAMHPNYEKNLKHTPRINAFHASHKSTVISRCYQNIV